MTFIHSIYLSTSTHRSSTTTDLYWTYKRIEKEKKEKEEREKNKIPLKCKNCAYRFFNFCFQKEEDITKIDQLTVNKCSEMENLIERRKLLKKAKWSEINKTILKILLSNMDPHSNSALIYQNFDIMVQTFEVWELLTILAHTDEEPPFRADQLIPIKDYLEICERYKKYIKDLENGKLKLMENNQLPIDNTCDYATLILLKNFLHILKDNENAQFIQEMLTRDSSVNDIEAAISLLLEEGLLDTKSNNFKPKVKNINNNN